MRHETLWLRRKRWLAPLVALVAVLGVASAAQGAPSSGDPFGQLDRVSGVPGGVNVSGWTIDPDTSSPIYVWVAGSGAGRHLHASAHRPDVGRAYPTFGDHHGYSGFLPMGAGRQTVCVTSSNVASGGHARLGCRSVSVPGGDPFGNVERIAAVPGGVEIKGWTIDPDTSRPIYLWVTVDGSGRHVRAADARADVARAFPVYGESHGFHTTISAPPGSHRVCVVASDVGMGNHRTLGCSVVRTPGAEVSSSGVELEVLRLTNEARAAHGLPALVAPDCATAQALTRAQALVSAPSLEHAPLEPVMAACAPAGAAAENLARGFATARSMVDAWMDSPGHRANILNPHVDRLGTACVPWGGALLCSQVFLG